MIWIEKSIFFYVVIREYDFIPKKSALHFGKVRISFRKNQYIYFEKVENLLIIGIQNLNSNLWQFVVQIFNICYNVFDTLLKKVRG